MKRDEKGENLKMTFKGQGHGRWWPRVRRVLYPNIVQISLLVAF